MAKNIGTLVAAALRPNDDLDPIASAFANEIKGGKHSYATLAERDALIEARREWAMEVEVYNDGGNIGKYQLVYGAVDTVITNNANWALISSGGSGTVTGTGTDNYMTKWNAAGSGIEDAGVIDRHNEAGSGMGFHFFPKNSINVSAAMRMSLGGAQTGYHQKYGVWFRNQSSTATVGGTEVVGAYFNCNPSADTAVGVDVLVSNGGVEDIAYRGRINGGGIGSGPSHVFKAENGNQSDGPSSSFFASDSSNNGLGDKYGFWMETSQGITGDYYGLVLDIDNTGAGAGDAYIGILNDNRTTGIGKVLTDIDGNGKAEWATAGGVTGTGTDNVIPRWNAAGTGLEDSNIVDELSGFSGQIYFVSKIAGINAALQGEVSIS